MLNFITCWLKLRKNECTNCQTKIHSVEKPNLESYMDAARNNPKSNTAPEKHARDKGQMNTTIQLGMEKSLRVRIMFIMLIDHQRKTRNEKREVFKDMA